MSGNFREKMPICASVYDEFTAVFGKVQLTYAEENGIVRGRPSPAGVTPSDNHKKPVKKARKS